MRNNSRFLQNTEWMVKVSPRDCTTGRERNTDVWKSVKGEFSGLVCIESSGRLLNIPGVGVGIKKLSSGIFLLCCHNGSRRWGVATLSDLISSWRSALKCHKMISRHCWTNGNTQKDEMTIRWNVLQNDITSLLKKCFRKQNVLTSLEVLRNCRINWN